MIPLIHRYHETLHDICRRFNVRRLELFGSASENSADDNAHDIDLLVEFTPDYDLGPWMKNFFDLRDQLQNLFDKPVDLTMPGSMHNPYFRREVNRTRKTLFTAHAA